MTAPSKVETENYGTGEPDLAVIVLSFRAPHDLVDAVKSLTAQDTPVEIVVINSGGGGAARLLRRHAIDVPVVEFEEQLFAGAARNRGIQATRAPIVAFLASDCLATAGWAAARVDAHRSKAAVGSALVTSDPDKVLPWAAHLSLFVRRLPGTPPEHALVYGASYDRSLFEEYGSFREDLRVSEDYEFHGRLPADLKPVWWPGICTVHRNPNRLRDLLWDQFIRGNRAAAAIRGMDGTSPRRLVWSWWRRIRDPIKISKTAVGPTEMSVVRWAWALLPLTATAYCLGAAWPSRLDD